MCSSDLVRCLNSCEEAACRGAPENQGSEARHGGAREKAAGRHRALRRSMSECDPRALVVQPLTERGPGDGLHSNRLLDTFLLSSRGLCQDPSPSFAGTPTPTLTERSPLSVRELRSLIEGVFSKPSPIPTHSRDRAPSTSLPWARIPPLRRLPRTTNNPSVVLGPCRYRWGEGARRCRSSSSTSRRDVTGLPPRLRLRPHRPRSFPPGRRSAWHACSSRTLGNQRTKRRCIRR